jgi:hypothetical protein
MSTSMQAGQGKRSGWLMLAAIVMFSVGFLRIISALYYFAGSARINDLANGAFSNHLWLWGLWDLGIAALALYAGYSLLGGGAFGRVVGYVWAVFVIIESFMIIVWTPWFAVAMMTLAVLVIYGLAVASEPEEV